MSDTPRTAPPLAGIRVVEVGNFMAVPFCGMQLADLGAEVIKVENPRGGDLTRASGPFIAGESSNFVRLNRNKRSVALDLKSAAGKTLFRRLVATADVLIENLRPGTMSALGLGYDALRAESPRIVYLAATGFGSDGPYAELAGLDIIAQGMSGLMSITGEPGAAPVKVGVPIADLTCALYATIAVVAALRARDRDGTGQFIDVSLLESAVSLGVWEAGRYFATGRCPTQRLGPPVDRAVPGGALSGRLVHLRRQLAAALAARVRAARPGRAAGRRALRDQRAAAGQSQCVIALIEAVTTSQPTAHWSERMGTAGIPCGPIWTFDQVFADRHLAERGFFADAPHPALGPVRQLGSPMRFSRTPTRLDSAGPTLGADTADVLREIGVADDEIARLAHDGVAVSEA